MRLCASCYRALSEGTPESEEVSGCVYVPSEQKTADPRLDVQYCVHRDYYEKAKTAFREMAEKKPEVALGEYRDYLGCSRKVAVAFWSILIKTVLQEKQRAEGF